MAVLSSPANLKCEYTLNPLGMDILHPRLSWQLDDQRQGAKQTAYQVQVGLQANGSDLWDSGKVESDQCTQLPYGGLPLASGQRAWWRVRVWDHQGQSTPWSRPAFWEMGLLQPTDWQGQWITLPQKQHVVGGPALYLRKSFRLDKPVASARLYITARGVYVPYVNGVRIGTDLLTPGWTDYHIRIRYQTYDLTSALRQGDNTLGAILGDGWYAGHMTWQNRTKIYGDHPELLAQLHIQFADGQQLLIATDGSWKASAAGPLTSQSFLDGDTQDTRKAWDFSAPAYKDSPWAKVKTRALDAVKLIAQAGPTIQQINELPTQECWRLANGDWVFDLGQNMVGVVRLKIQGKRGQKIVLRHGEMLKGREDRSVYTANLRSALNTDTYILHGQGKQVLQPVFALHGFRYVQLSGLPGKATKEMVTGVVCHSATAPTGEFSCSHAKLNQLQHNILWGQKGNFIEVPTDCPQRDERLGWMGDAQVFAPTATFNMDVAGFFNRWMIDVGDAQLPDGAYTDVVPDVLSKRKTNSWGSGAPAWGDAGVICPWTIYQRYGDLRILEESYASMCRYIDFQDRRCPEGIHPDFGYGDWLAIASDTNKQLIGTAYTAYSISLMRKIAHLLNKPEDERRFAALFEKFKAAFNREFVTPAGRLISQSQTAAILALRFGLVEEPLRNRIATWLGDDITNRGVVTTGFVGCNLILPTLSQIGRDDLAWMLLTNEKFPSWLFSVNQGATTIWERWDGWTPEKGFQDVGMNSFNHYAYGSCGQWMYARIGAIECDDAAVGFKHIRINPVLARGLHSAKASLLTMYGQVRVEWTLRGEKFVMNLKVPANSTATVMLPGKYTDGNLDKEMIQGEKMGRTHIELPAGRYRLESVLLSSTR